MKIRATFARDGEWWVAWSEDLPGALTQGKSIAEARENLLDAVREIQTPFDLSGLPASTLVVEELEV